MSNEPNADGRFRRVPRPKPRKPRPPKPKHLQTATPPVRTVEQVDKDIAALENQKLVLRRERSQLLREAEDEERQRHCVRIVCLHCEGSGKVSTGSWADNTDFYDEPCETCRGRGFIYAVPYGVPKPPGTAYVPPLHLDERER